MPFTSQVEQWRQYAKWECKDIPVDLVLAIIRGESNGVAGRKSRASIRTPGTLPKADGSAVQIKNAYGLMQCVPALINDYNTQHSNAPIYFEDISGNNERAARLQIRCGCWYFSRCVLNLHRYDPQLFPAKTPGGASTQQLQLALIAYAIGFGSRTGKRGLAPKLTALKQLRQPLTLAALAANFPNWGKGSDGVWHNRPVQGAVARWRSYEHNATGAGSGSAPTNPTGQPLPNEPKTGIAAIFSDNKDWLWIVGILAAAYYANKSGLLKKLTGEPVNKDPLQQG